MKKTVFTALVSLCILILCIPGASAGADISGSAQAPESEDIPDFSACDIPNGSFLNPYCPIWDGDNAKPDPFLIYDYQKKIVAAALKAQGKNSPQIDAGVLTLAPPTGWRGLPTTGTVRVPVFLVDFSDAPHNTSQTAADVQLKMFGEGNGGYPYESMKNYYQRSSYNQLTITGDVYGWYRAAQPRAYYLSLGKPQGRIALMNEILQAYDNQVNFAEYDSDHNGKIDSLFIKWAGADNGWSNFWWACMSTTSSAVTVDGVAPYKYVWSWYSKPDGGVYSPHVDIHETGHLLGLPDYYDYDDSVGPKGGVGGWDMMDYNWGDHNAFSKYLLGWIDPIVISSGSREITLPPTSTTSTDNAVIIMPGTVPESFGEYFLVQYREPGTGNDPLTSGLNKAIWIWHVDSTLTSGGYGYLYDNSYTSHKILRLMEADGLEEIEAGNGDWDVSDFYVPGKTIGPATVPNSNNYTGSATNVAVYDIQQLVSSMRVDFSILSAGPGAAFSGTPVYGTTPLGVTFTDSSTGASITSRRWDFGDGNISTYATATNPCHIYTRAGSYSVNLTVTNSSGTDSEVRVNYITVTPAPLSGMTSSGVFRPSTRQFIFNTIPTTRTTFGLSTDIPITGDWDGDSITDIGVFRPSSKEFIFNTTPVTRTTFGLSTDIPFTGDWNGDSITDIGVFRPSSREFIFNTTPITRTTFGLSTDIPITGDWDGDSISDIGVFRPSTRQFILNTTPVTRTTFGLSTDIPITGDWDGDSLTDIGVFRPSSREFIFNTTPGTRTTFGMSTDIPITGTWK